MTLELALDIIKVLVGFVVGLAGAHFVTAKDVSFMKGQLTNLVGVFAEVQKIIKTQGELKALTNKQKADLNSYYERLRTLEEKVEDHLTDLPPLSQQ